MRRATDTRKDSCCAGHAFCMPVAQRAKNKEFNLHTAFFSFPHPSPSGSFHFSSPHLSLSGSEFSLEIRELEQDTLCLSVRLSDYTLQ